MEHIKLLKSYGFDIETFGYKAFKVSGIPPFMSLSEAELFLNYYMENIEEKNNIADSKHIDKIISNACKSAIKAGKVVNEQEISSLFKQLDNCENPYSCPHGRPTFVKLSKYQIERMFKRI